MVMVVKSGEFYYVFRVWNIEVLISLRIFLMSLLWIWIFIYLDLLLEEIIVMFKLNFV